MVKHEAQVTAQLNVCVMPSFTLNQFSANDRKKFEETLSHLSATRNIWRIGLEWIGTENPELTLDRFAEGKKITQQKLATCHQHGEWINWH